MNQEQTKLLMSSLWLCSRKPLSETCVTGWVKLYAHILEITCIALHDQSKIADLNCLTPESHKKQQQAC